MFVIKCKGCGKEFTAKSEYRKFCDAVCYNRYHKIKNAPIPREVACRYADGVVCSKRDCEKCGWNPKTADARLEKLHAEMEARYGK